MTSTYLKQAAGFLLVPLLAVLFVRGVTLFLGDGGNDSRQVITKQETRRLVQALDAFLVAHHRLPTVEEGLRPLSRAPLGTVPTDAWGRPFVYVLDMDARWADVISYGADGLPGGRGDAADISGKFGSKSPAPPVAVGALGQILFFGLLLLGLLGARRWAWAAGMLAGTAACCAIILLTLIARPFDLSTVGILAPVVTILCMTGSVAVLRRIRGATWLTAGIVLCAYTLLGVLLES